MATKTAVQHTLKDDLISSLRGSPAFKAFAAVVEAKKAVHTGRVELSRARLELATQTKRVQELERKAMAEDQAILNGQGDYRAANAAHEEVKVAAAQATGAAERIEQLQARITAAEHEVARLGANGDQARDTLGRVGRELQERAVAMQAQGLQMAAIGSEAAQALLLFMDAVGVPATLYCRPLTYRWGDLGDPSDPNSGIAVWLKEAREYKYPV